MYQRTRIILDWAITISAYFSVLLIIPLSDKFLGHLNENTVDVVLNSIINILTGSAFICLLIYLIRRGKSSPFPSYLWLIILFMISAYLLMKVEITRDRLHFLGYGILSLFLYRELRHNIGTEMLYVWSGIFIMLFAIFDEVIQISGWGGRSFEFKDIGMDWFSSLIGQCIIAKVVRPKLEMIDIKIRRYVESLEQLKVFREKHK